MPLASPVFSFEDLQSRTTLKVLVQFILADSLRDLSSLVLTRISRLQRAKFDLESCLAKPVAPVAYTKFRGASKWEWAF